MTNKERDELFDVVWSGEEGLVADRETKVLGTWVPPKRLYNKTGKHTVRGECQVDPHVARVCERGTSGCVVRHRKVVDKPVESVQIDTYGDGISE